MTPGMERQDSASTGKTNKKKERDWEPISKTKR